MLNRRQFLLSAGALAASCSSVRPVPTVYKADHPGYPYHPIVFQLDLSILTYQLYGQSLVWPFDPYYEDMVGWTHGRDRFLDKVRSWVASRAATHGPAGDSLARLRGPGVLSGRPNNPGHDPILYRYSQVYPWTNCLNRPLRWVLYKTPRAITGRINDVYVCVGGNASGGEPRLIKHLANPARSTNAGDTLFCFEGGTGDKGEPGQPASQSLMGCVLLRDTGSRDYDVHIAFRGSRSGAGGRALRQALSHKDARGNPDWITDMGYTKIGAKTGARSITTTGAVSRGFTTSMASMMPQVMAVLTNIAELRAGVAPSHITVTGHSLGGGLAQMFTSAILLGGDYGPNATGPNMPKRLAAWPWRSIKLVTFSSPRAGNAEWARILTETKLQSEFFTSRIAPTDSDALRVTDETIVARLLARDRPAAYRVLISTDPITTEKVGGGGKHVGKTVYVDQRRVFPVGLDFAAHEIGEVRDYITTSLGDKRVPPSAWAYPTQSEVNPGRVDGNKGSVTEVKRLAAALARYSKANGLHLDPASYDRDVAAFIALMS